MTNGTKHSGPIASLPLIEDMQSCSFIQDAKMKWIKDIISARILNFHAMGTKTYPALKYTQTQAGR